MRRVERSRIAAAAGVAALHVLIGYGLITGLGIGAIRHAAQQMKLFTLEPERPPPLEKPVPAKTAARAPVKRQSSPKNLKAEPTPLVTPSTVVRLSSPMVAAPVAGQGLEASAGASDSAGPGIGAGGSGSGSGGGGLAARAERIAGRLLDSDYPRAVRRAGIEGIVYVRFTVRPDGGVGACAVTRSSGSKMLDETTCRLIQRRFRYRPARDAQGRPIADEVSNFYEWRLGPRPPG